MRLLNLGIPSAFFLTSILVACNPSEEGTTATPDSAPSAASSAVSSTQSDNTEELTSPNQQASVDGAPPPCPPDLASQARRDNAPVDDIVGIRPGMHIDDVLAVLECRSEVEKIEFGGTFGVSRTYDIETRQLLRASNGQECSGQEIVRAMSSGGECGHGGRGFMPLKEIDQQFVVALTGMPGEEKAGVIWRKTRFTEDGRPTQESVRSSLEQKYGELHSIETDRRGRDTLVWVYDLMGRPMSPQAPSHYMCVGSTINPTFDSGQSWRPDCGLTIKAQLTPARGNEYLLEQMELVVADQKAFYEGGEAMEVALVDANNRRQRQEAEDAEARSASLDL